jgi:hypothetical protein
VAMGYSLNKPGHVDDINLVLTWRFQHPRLMLAAGES